MKLNKALKDKIKSELKQKATPRHVPSEIYAVKEIRRTISGKKVEIATKSVIGDLK